MIELTPEQFDSSRSEDADEDAVEHYLTGYEQKEILRLAAELSPTRKKINPDEAVKDAMDLMSSASSLVVSHRQKLLRSMNFNTLMLLLNRIGYNLVMLSQDRHITGIFSPSGEPEINDPLKAPIFEIIRYRLPNLPKDPMRHHRLDVEEAIARASDRSKVVRPDLPCSLEAALRWAANAPKVPFNALKRAFTNYLETKHETEEELDDLSEYCSQELKRAIGNASRSAELRQELTDIKNSRAYLNLVKRHASTFKPGKTVAPKKIASRVRKTMMYAFSEPDSIELNSTLADIAENFYPFWEKHGPTYLDLATRKSATKKKSGKDGPTSRMRAVWENRTERFICFFKEREVPANGSDEWIEFFEEFSRTQADDRRTQKKIEGYMRTLFRHVVEPITTERIDNIIDSLKFEKIKAVAPETIRTCLVKLKAHDSDLAPILRTLSDESFAG